MSIAGVLAGCANYGNPKTYSNLACEDIRTLYGTESQRLLQTTNMAPSQLDKAKPGEIVIATPSNKIENIITKQESDLRAAYKANGC